jgi:hypothetical protein
MAARRAESGVETAIESLACCTRFGTATYREGVA